MDNKYYTPKIEEFHIGFECEIKDIPPPEEDWHQHIISKYNQFELLEEWLEEKSIRVKWLDIEDCESLGWEQPDKNGWYHFKDNYRYRLYLGSGMLPPNSTHLELFIHSKTSDDDKPANSPVFRGIVKNKSELKRLMEQLGI